MNHLLSLKNKIPYIILLVLIVSTTIVLLIKEEKELIIISNDSVYSRYHSDSLESFTIELLTNSPEDYYFNKEYISTMNISNNDQLLSIEVKEITKSTEPVLYDNEDFYLIGITAKLPLSSNDLLIQLDDCFLTIDYSNGKSIKVKIGEFNYLFLDEQGTDVSLNNLSATHELINEINSIGGVSLELGNLSDFNIIITDINILSINTNFNKGAIIEREECFYTTRVVDCLGVDLYSFTYPSDVDETDILVRKNNSISLYLPITYSNSYNFLYQFSIIIEYEVNGRSKTTIIDDFPYMRTSIFTSLEEDDVYVYKIQD